MGWISGNILTLSFVIMKTMRNRQIICKSCFVLSNTNSAPCQLQIYGAVSKTNQAWVFPWQAVVCSPRRFDDSPRIFSCSELGPLAWCLQISGNKYHSNALLFWSRSRKKRVRFCVDTSMCGIMVEVVPPCFSEQPWLMLETDKMPRDLRRFEY